MITAATPVGLQDGLCTTTRIHFSKTWGQKNEVKKAVSHGAADGSFHQELAA
jgi:hypothetical protein